MSEISGASLLIDAGVALKDTCSATLRRSRKALETTVNTMTASSPLFFDKRACSRLAVEVLSLIVDAAVAGDFPTFLALAHTARQLRLLSGSSYLKHERLLVTAPRNGRRSLVLRLSGSLSVARAGLVISIAPNLLQDYPELSLDCDLCHLVRYRKNLCQLVSGFRTSWVRIQIGSACSPGSFTSKNSIDFALIDFLSSLKPEACGLSLEIGNAYHIHSSRPQSHEQVGFELPVGLERLHAASKAMQQVRSLTIDNPSFCNAISNSAFPMFLRGESITSVRLICMTREICNAALSLLNCPALQSFDLTVKDRHAVILSTTFVNSHTNLQICTLLSDPLRREKSLKHSALISKETLILPASIKKALIQSIYRSLKTLQPSRPMNLRISPSPSDVGLPCEALNGLCTMLSNSNELDLGSLGLLFPIQIAEHARLTRVDASICTCMPLPFGSDQRIMGVAKLSVLLETYEEYTHGFLTRWLAWFPRIQTLVIDQQSRGAPAGAWKPSKYELERLRSSCPTLECFGIYTTLKTIDFPFLRTERNIWHYNLLTKAWTVD